MLNQNNRRPVATKRPDTIEKTIALLPTLRIDDLTAEDGYKLTCWIGPINKILHLTIGQVIAFSLVRSFHSIPRVINRPNEAES